MEILRYILVVFFFRGILAAVFGLVAIFLPGVTLRAVDTWRTRWDGVRENYRDLSKS